MLILGPFAVSLQDKQVKKCHIGYLMSLEL